MQGEVVEPPEAIAAAEKGWDKFILATGELDEERLPAAEMLLAYKGQGMGPERGFRFLKDPWFFADTLFLESPKRMMALVMGLGLVLLVYALAEHQLRIALREQGESVPNQLRKPTQRPTMRRIFQMFEGIDLLLITTQGEKDFWSFAGGRLDNVAIYGVHFGNDSRSSCLAGAERRWNLAGLRLRGRT